MKLNEENVDFIHTTKIEENGLMDFQVLKSTESENHIFGSWCCVCMVSVCAVIKLSEKQIVSETPDLVFYICTSCRWNLKLFIKIRQTIRLQGHSKKFEYIIACGRNFL